jgi:GNAT superfamily N-acetyltransferase
VNSPEVRGTVLVDAVAWVHPGAAGLRAEQQAELTTLYDGVEDLDPELPPEQMVHTVLVRLSGKPVATGSLRVGGALPDGVGELKRMFVLPAFRGRGYSRLVLDSLEDAARERGLSRLVLETGMRQDAAIALYESAGYRTIPNFGIYADEPTSICLGRSLVDRADG